MATRGRSGPGCTGTHALTSGAAGSTEASDGASASPAGSSASSRLSQHCRPIRSVVSAASSTGQQQWRRASPIGAHQTYPSPPTAPKTSIAAAVRAARKRRKCRDERTWGACPDLGEDASRSPGRDRRGHIPVVTAPDARRGGRWSRSLDRHRVVSCTCRDSGACRRDRAHRHRGRVFGGVDLVDRAEHGVAEPQLLGGAARGPLRAQLQPRRRGPRLSRERPRRDRDLRERADGRDLPADVRVAGQLSSRAPIASRRRNTHARPGRNALHLGAPRAHHPNADRSMPDDFLSTLVDPGASP